MEILIITDGVTEVTGTLKRKSAISDELKFEVYEVRVFDLEVSFRRKYPRETLALSFQ